MSWLGHVKAVEGKEEGEGEGIFEHKAVDNRKYERKQHCFS